MRPIPSDVDRRAGVKGALLHTLPGRAIVVGVTIRLAIVALARVFGSVPAFLGVVDSVASLAAAVGAGYFLVRLALMAQRRLLWRVRRKLLLSYIFVGLIP